ncbi:MAG: hypothetical protein SVQ76_00700 [Candidatus Nanohaloarchaea archaeon]|nr:hypothetical protein [Candidatus Nanohaloarchaea archaeon]
MPFDASVMWKMADIVSALILLSSLILMAKFYQEYLEVGISEMRNWKLITLGFAFYVAVKTHFTFLSAFIGGNTMMDSQVAGYPFFIVAFLSVLVVTSAILVFLGFYGLIEDYL